MKIRTTKKRLNLLMASILMLIFVLMTSSDAQAATKKKVSIGLNKTTATIYTTGKKTVQLKAKVKGTSAKVKWKSNNTSVATVSGKGKVTAKSAGTATIVAKVKGVTAKCKVTVKTENKTSNGYKTIIASSENISERTAGNITFSYNSRYINGIGTYGSIYYNVGGQQKLLVSMKGLGSQIVTNGTDVFFYTCGDGRASLYSRKLSDTVNTRLFEILVDDTFELVGTYNNNLYYIKGLDPGKLCRYSLSTKKHKVLANNTTSAKQVNQYFYLTPYRGDAGPVTLKIYNAKTGKTKLVTKNMDWYYLVGNYVYYTEYRDMKGLFYSPYKISVKRCKLNGSGTKTLVDSIKVKNVLEVTAKKIVYIDQNGNRKQKSY